MITTQNSSKKPRVLIIGAGLAGSEAALYLANKQVEVYLLEVKRLRLGPAQKTSDCAELVCTNSLKSKNPHSGHGLLKQEMCALGSIVLEVAEQAAVPAGEALAVDRELFARGVTEKLESHRLIHLIDREAANPLELKQEFECDYVVIASGPLTTSTLEKWLIENLSGDDFYFYDSIAPVVDAESLERRCMYFKDRYDKGENAGDYLNVPLNREQYDELIADLVAADKVPMAAFEEKKFFEACLPIDVMAERGKETLRFSCLKPVGLETPEGLRPHAVLQLRRENLLGSAFNLVGFQNRLTYSEQVRVFRKLPGFERAHFIHLGSVHRNSFLNAKKLLNFDLSSRQFPELYFAGQIVGVEGYTESASMGLYVGFQIWRRLQGLPPALWPVETAVGGLINYIMTIEKPSPSNINFGLLPALPIEKRPKEKRMDRKKRKKALIAQRAKAALEQFRSECKEF